MATIILSDSIEVDFGSATNKKIVSLADKTPEWFEWAIAFGLRQSIKDAGAGKAGTPEGDAAVQAKFEKVCIAGEVPTRGAGGGGASIEDRIDSKYLAKMGLKGKLEELDTRWLEFAKATVLESVGTTERAKLAADKARLSQLATEYLDAVKEAARASDDWIAIKTSMNKIKEKPAIKITLK